MFVRIFIYLSVRMYSFYGVRQYIYIFVNPNVLLVRQVRRCQTGNKKSLIEDGQTTKCVLFIIKHLEMIKTITIVTFLFRLKTSLYDIKHEYKVYSHQLFYFILYYSPILLQYIMENCDRFLFFTNILVIQYYCYYYSECLW